MTCGWAAAAAFNSASAGAMGDALIDDNNRVTPMRATELATRASRAVAGEVGGEGGVGRRSRWVTRARQAARGSARRICSSL